MFCLMLVQKLHNQIRCQEEYYLQTVAYMYSVVKSGFYNSSVTRTSMVLVNLRG